MVSKLILVNSVALMYKGCAILLSISYHLLPKFAILSLTNTTGAPNVFSRLSCPAYLAILSHSVDVAQLTHPLLKHKPRQKDWKGKEERT